MLLRRVPVPLALQAFESVDETGPGVTRIDDIIEIAAARGDVRMREMLPILLDLRIGRGGRVFGFRDFPAIEDLDGSLRSHHGDLRRWPCDVEVAANVL